ncbi:MAG: PQQ-binding-like beta-propeller repeat protein, partial [Candidatus Bipolaricaulota bacterium]
MAENISYLWAFKNYVTTLSIIVFLIGCFSPARARDPQVIISEVAWMGTEASYTEEWIELYNRSDQPIDITDWQLVAKSGTPSITLQGTIPASGYFLLERTSDETIPSLPADQIYSGSLANDGEVLQLINSGGETVDQNSLTDGGWPAGSNPSEEPEDWGTMERIIESSGEVGGWATFDGCSFEAQDSEGSYINGTPGLCNCSSSCPSGSIKWSFGQAELGVSTSPTLDSEGNIYIGTKGGKIYSLSPNGKTRGDVLQVEGEVSGLSIDEDGILYAGTAYSDPFTSSKVYAFDTTVWEKRWEFSTGGAVYGTPSIDSEKGCIYFGSYDTKVYAVSSSNGERVWEFSIGDTFEAGILASGAIDHNNRVITGAGNGFVSSLEQDSGQVHWETQVDSAIPAPPALTKLNNGVIYVGTNAGEILAIGLDTGEILWSFTSGDQVKSSPAIGKEGLIYVGSTDGYLYALRPAELESTEERLKWKLHVGAPVTSTPAIGSENTLYFGAQDGYTYALELPSSTASSPTVKWKKGLDEEVRSSPALSKSGNLYVTSHEGSLYALRTAGEQLESTSWPTFQHDSRRTGKVTPNHPPQARIDGPQNKQLKLGHFLNLDASRSTDGDGGASNLQFYWEIKDKPDTSSPRLTNEEGAKPTLFTDKPGTYTLQLTLTDRFGASQQEDISVEVTENSQVKNETLQG